MIDWARVSELKDEVGEEELAEVIEIFTEEIGEALDGLEQGNATDLKDGLHFVKGSALNIGMRQVSDLCRTAEEVAQNGVRLTVDLSEIRRAFVESVSELTAPTHM